MWTDCRRRWRQLGFTGQFLVMGLGVIAAGLAWFLWPTSDAPAEVTRNQLEMRDGRLCLLGESKPFTGLLVADYIGSEQRKSTLPLRKGIIHGVVKGWHENGQMEVEENFVQGVSHGLRTRWYENGEKRSEVEIADGELDGRYIEWHENGQKAVEMSLIEGKAEGLAEAWFPDGSLKSRSVMKNGEVSDQEFFQGAATGVVTQTASKSQ